MTVAFAPATGHFCGTGTGKSAGQAPLGLGGPRPGRAGVPIKDRLLNSRRSDAASPRVASDFWSARTNEGGFARTPNPEISERPAAPICFAFEIGLEDRPSRGPRAPPAC